MKNNTYDLEYNLIGSFLSGGLTPQAREVMTWLEPEMFSTFKLGAIYNNIRKQARKDNLIDIVLLNQDFGEDFANLAEIAHKNTSSANLTGYAQKVRTEFINRSAQKQMLEFANKLQNARADETTEITTTALENLQKLLASKVETKSEKLGDLLDGYIDVISEKSKPDFKDRLLYTGINAVDNILGGINPTDITIVAGRPGTGKTEFALTVTRNIVENGGKVLFFSLEMDNFQLIDRLLSACSGVSVSTLRNPKNLRQADFGRISNYIGQAKKQDLFFVDKGGLTAEEIQVITENHLAEKGNLDAIFIDYLGLINHENSKLSIREKFNEILFSLKTFSKKIKVPIILLAQLNRNTDGRGDKRPVNADLRESGKIEEDASQIIMLYREKNYNPNSDNDYSEAIITKNRFGKLGTAYMKFEKGHFTDCDQLLAYEASVSKANANNKEFSKRYGNRN